MHNHVYIRWVQIYIKQSLYRIIILQNLAIFLQEHACRNVGKQHSTYEPTVLVLRVRLLFCLHFDYIITWLHTLSSNDVICKNGGKVEILLMRLNGHMDMPRDSQ